ncbi:hypothetical protein KI387_034421, partial [Taxus chinensis]
KTEKSVADYLTDFTDMLTLCDYTRPCGDYAVQKRPILLIRLMIPNPIWAVFHTVPSFAEKPPQPATKIISFWRYDGTANFSSGHCYLESIVYSLRTNKPREKFYNSTAYIKIQRTSNRGKSSVIVISAGTVSGAVVLFLLCWAWRIKSKRKKQEEKKNEDDPVDWLTGLPLRYSFNELLKATNDFSMKLGSGEFGSVYDGILIDGTKIAVKCLDSRTRNKRIQGRKKSHRMLVYEHLPNGSLDKWIFSNETCHHVLDWKTRFKVVLHIARGLTYLHEECRERIIHFDIKPQNILLDQNFNAKVSDFGLAKLNNREESEVITMMKGTPGSMAPELLNMHITEKADIFSFGVMVVEIVSGTRNRELSGHGLLSVLQSKAEEGRLIELVDSGLEDEGMDVKEEAVKMLEVGMWCMQDDFTRRPAMSTVVKALEGMIEINNSHFTSSSTLDQPLDRLLVRFMKTWNITVWFSWKVTNVLSIISEGHSVFFIGPARTGKTFLLRHAITIIKDLHGDECDFFTASTGMVVSALNGTMLHSFVGIICTSKKVECLVLHLSKIRDAKLRWQTEKAMVDCGDRCFDIQIELTDIYRQSNSDFTNLLNEIGWGKYSNDSIEILKTHQGLPNEEGSTYTKLYFLKLNRLLAVKEINLCIDAEVILRYYLGTERGLVNGSR